MTNCSGHRCFVHRIRRHALADFYRAAFGIRTGPANCRIKMDQQFPRFFAAFLILRRLIIGALIDDEFLKMHSPIEKCILGFVIERRLKITGIKRTILFFISLKGLGAARTRPLQFNAFLFCIQDCLTIYKPSIFILLLGLEAVLYQPILYVRLLL